MQRLASLLRMEPTELSSGDKRDSAHAQLAESLTERELDVLRLLAMGRSNQQIAAELVVALGTVKRHVNSILGKLQVESRLAAVVRARELHILG
jgi:LuxR family maltose regulon positive regulatory protein